MNPCFSGRRLLASATLAWMVATAAHAAFFSWEEGVSGNFTDPQRWHGPDFPMHTRFPGAGDDASISRGPLTVTISGAQATRELVVSQPTFRILGSYTVTSLFSQGSPFTVTGDGRFQVTLWQMGSENIVDGGNAGITTLQPLGASPPSILAVRNGAQVRSESLDLSRGAFRAVVSGGGATWTHAAALPFCELVLRSNGRVEVPSTEGVFADVEGGGALLTVSGRFAGYGRVARGGRIESHEGLLAGQSMTLDGGAWAVRGLYVNQGVDLAIRNGGALSADTVQPGDFSSVTTIEGSGSRFEVGGLLRPLGGFQIRQGGRLSAGSFEMDLGGVLAEREGVVDVAGDLFANNGMNVLDGGVLRAGAVFLADDANRFGMLRVGGPESRAEIRGALAVGQSGEGELRVDRGGRVSSGTAGLGVFAGAKGRVSLDGARSQWIINPSSGGALLLGGGGFGEMSVVAGGRLQAAGAGQVILGRDAAAEGRLFVRGFGSAADFKPGSVIVGQRGRGWVELENGGELLADTLRLGMSPADNRILVNGEDAVLGVLNEAVVGDGGLGTLAWRGGAQGVVKRLAIGRASTADNRVTLDGAGTRVSGSGRMDVGEFEGRGTLELRNTAEALPAAGLSVGIYDRSRGTLLVEGGASLSTPGDVILGGGDASQATATIRQGGTLDALDFLVFARANGVATASLSESFAALFVARDFQVGFARGPAGPTRVVAGPDSLVQVGSTLRVGRNGRFHADGGRVVVGAANTPPPGVVRVGGGGLLTGSGLVQGVVEVLAGGRVSPGSSPGAITVQGSITFATGSRLEMDLAGTTPVIGYDVLHVTGAVALGGTLVLNFTEGFAPREGQTFGLLVCDGGIQGAVAAVEVAGLTPGFEYTLTADGLGRLTLRADNDGHSTTIPTLHITAATAVEVAISWAANGTWTLESAPSLAGAWSPVTQSPRRVADQFVVTLPASQSTAFFRLR
ncbi:MAG: hypothetical protein J0L84_03960 [Verrucomicrobia bacterium]|nr:hypothetical protein [Verrucomicrobiota bacterium]